MTTEPATLLLHTYPAENEGTPADLERAIRNRIPDIHLERVNTYEEARQRIPNAEVVIEHRIDDELLSLADNLRWIQSLSSGVDRFDLDALERRGVALTTVSGVHANPISEHVLGYALLFERRLLETLRQQSRKEWRPVTPGELSSRTVGIVGVGAIGGRIAERCAALGMTVLGVRRKSTTPQAVDELFAPDELDSVLARADYLVLSCPLTEETEGLLGERELRAMKESAVLINVARGAIVETEALVDALRSGVIAGAALDVTDPEPLPPESPLWNLSNVILTPHLSGGSPRYTERCAEIFETNYRAFEAGDRERMTNRVV